MDLVFYILFLFALVEPLLAPVLARMMHNRYRQTSSTQMQPAQFFTTLSIIKMSLVESIYIFGLVVYLISGDVLKMLWFYPIGVIWTFVLWPRRSNLQQMIKATAAVHP